MTLLSKTDSEFYHLKQLSGASSAPENYVSEKHGFYKALGGETKISAGDLQGGSIKWSAQDYLQIKVIRSIGGEQIPRMPQMGNLGWGVDLSSPPYIQFSTPLTLNEIVYVTAPNRFTSVVRPEGVNFTTPVRETILAGTTKITFQLSRPLPLSWLNGQFRSIAYDIEVDGIGQTLNNPGTTDGDYTENRINGTDTFDSITFNIPVGDPSVDINVKLQSLGFYDADNISLQQLVSNTERLNNPTSIIVSNSSGMFFSPSTTFVDIPNLTKTITSKGSPIWVKLEPDQTTNSSSIGSDGGSSFSGDIIGIEIRILRNGVPINVVASYGAGGNDVGGNYRHRTPPNISIIDDVSSGTYIYKIQARVLGNDNFIVQNTILKLIRFNEL